MWLKVKNQEISACSIHSFIHKHKPVIARPHPNTYEMYILSYISSLYFVLLPSENCLLFIPSELAPQLLLRANVFHQQF